MASSPGSNVACSRCGKNFSRVLTACPFCNEPAPAQAVLGPGSILDGKYEILSLLGGGSMGVVFKARHVDLDAIRAIKVMKKSLVADESFRGRFLREAKLATRVQHPHVATFHDFSTMEDGTCYIVSEFVDGRTVRQVLSQDGPFPLETAATLAVQVLSGLEQIHRRGLVHRDLSADNVMIATEHDGSIVAKIIDLGVAKAVEDSEAPGETTAVTQVNMFVGNARYASPEQFGDLQPGERIDHRADIYCFGIVLYEMLTGKAPYKAKNHQEWMIRHLTEAPAPFREVNPSLNLPQELERVVMRALEKDRKKRFDTAAMFAQALVPFTPIGASSGSGAVAVGDQTTGLRDRRVLDAVERAKTVEFHQAAAELAEREARMAEERRAEDAKRAENARRLADEARRAAEDARRAEENAGIERVRMHETQRDVRELEIIAASAKLSDSVRRAAREASDRILASIEAERRAAESRLWDEARARNQADGWKRFIDAFPRSALREEAERNHAEALAYDEAVRIDTTSRWSQFLSTWPDGAHIHEATKRYENRSALDRIRDLEDRADARELEALGHFSSLDETVRQAARAAAERTRTRLEEQRRVSEARSFDDASVQGTVDAWRRFLEAYPLSARRAEAESALAEARAYEAAALDDSMPGWREFLRLHPNGQRSGAASRRLHELTTLERIRRCEEAGEILELEALARSAELDDTLRRTARGAADRTLARVTEERRLAEANAWKQAESSANPDAWRRFISDFPTSERIELATERLAEATDFENAGREGTPAAWEEFLREWPSGVLAAPARSFLERTEKREGHRAFARAESEDTRDAYRKFIEQYPDSVHAGEAAKRLVELEAYYKAATVDTEDVWRRFIAEFPGGRHTAEAVKRIGMARERRESIVKRALATQTLAALDEVVSRHLEAGNWPEIREHRLELDDLELSRKGGVAECERFLQRHAQSPYADEVWTRLHRIRENKAYSDARTADTPEAWKKYLEEWPEGTRVAEVRDRIDRLELDLAVRANRVEVFEAYIHGHPKAKVLPEARQRLSELQAFQSAVRAGGDEALRAYLSKWPHGANARAARERLALVDETVIGEAPPDLDSVAPEDSAEDASATAPRLGQRAAGVLQHGPTRFWAALAAVVVVIVIGMTVALQWFSRREEARAAANKPPPQTTTVVESAPATPDRQTLIIESIPRSFVASIKDAFGKEWIGDKKDYTPVAVVVPPGTYYVTFEHPSSPYGLEKTIEVKRGQRNVVRTKLFDGVSVTTDTVITETAAPIVTETGLGTSRDALLPVYDTNTPVTLRGKVVSIYNIPGHSFLALVMATENGEIEVILGPAAFVGQAGFQIRAGDAIEVAGSKVTWQESERVIARKVTRDGRVLTFRDELGRSMW